MKAQTTVDSRNVPNGSPRLSRKNKTRVTDVRLFTLKIFLRSSAPPPSRESEGEREREGWMES